MNDARDRELALQVRHASPLAMSGTAEDCLRTNMELFATARAEGRHEGYADGVADVVEEEKAAVEAYKARLRQWVAARPADTAYFALLAFIEEPTMRHRRLVRWLLCRLGSHWHGYYGPSHGFDFMAVCCRYCGRKHR